VEPKVSGRAVATSRAAQRRTLRRLVIIAVAAALVTAAIAIPRVLRGRGGVDRAPPPDASAPEGQRVRVQVLNATTTRGLARRAMLHLRDRGFDVVELGTASEQLDSTLVLDRSGHAEWAKRVADAMGTGRVEARPDTSRYLDVTVLVGRSWRPPSEPFYP
jgi:hypothetical protein